jgi:hypothetical protein
LGFRGIPRKDYPSGSADTLADEYFRPGQQITGDRGKQHRAELEIPPAQIRELRLLSTVLDKPPARIFAVASSAGLNVLLGEYAKMMPKGQKDFVTRLMGTIQCGLA